MSDERPERPDVDGPDSENPRPGEGETGAEGADDRHLDDTFTDAEPLAEHDDAELDLGDATPADDTGVEAQEDPALDAAADEDIALSEEMSARWANMVRLCNERFRGIALGHSQWLCQVRRMRPIPVLHRPCFLPPFPIRQIAWCPWH